MASYKKLASGWQYRVSYKDPSGNYSTKSENGFATKKEAQLAAAKIEELLGKGKSINGGKKVFIDYFRDWYTVYKEPFISHKTKKNYLLSIEICERYFKKMTFADITESKYQEFINQYSIDPKTKKERAKETVAKVNIHAKAVFKKALKSGIIHTDPTEDVIVGGYVKAQKEQVNYLSEKDQLKLTAELVKSLKPKEVSPYLLLFSLATGVRFSEAIGLTWDAINSKKGTVTIDKTWDLVETHDFAPTKNESSNRTITIDDFTLKYLDQLKVRQNELELNYKNLVFSVLGEEPPTNNSVNQSLKRALKRAGINNTITHHGLRHTHISLLLHKGVNIKYISRRAGHKDVSTTLNKYSHIIDEMEQTESKKVNEVMHSTYPVISSDLKLVENAK